MKNITLSKEVAIAPAVYATQGNAILGLRKSGKSYSATYLAEQLMGEKIPFTAFDPIGVWRNLKLPGKGHGFPVVVVGDDADLPLNPKAMPDIIRAAMREGVNLVIDLFSIRLSKADWRSIVEQAVTIILHENKQHGLRHVFIEEAAEFCPQIVRPDQAKVYSVMEKLARMGGNASLGYTLINQRAEAINKELLENCDMVFLHKQRGRNSVANLSKWLKSISPTSASEVEQSLPHLKSGECWILTSDATEFFRVQMPQKQSFHPDRENPMAAKPSGKTVDVSRWIEQLNASIKRHEEKPAVPVPKQSIAAPVQPVLKEVEKIVEVPILTEKDRELLTLAAKEIGAAQTAINSIRSSMEEMWQRLEKHLQASRIRSFTASKPAVVRTTPASLPSVRREPVVSDGEIKMTKAIRLMLTALAQHGDMNDTKIGAMVGIVASAGHYGNEISKAKRAGWITGEPSMRSITPEGLAALGPVEPLPTGQALVDYWKGKLPTRAGQILELLYNCRDGVIADSEIGEHIGIVHTAGHFGNTMSELTKRDLVTGTPSGRRIHEVFFQ